MPELKRRKDVEPKMSPRRETSLQVSGSNTEPLQGNQTGSIPVQCVNDSQEGQPETQEKLVRTTTNHS